MSDLKQRYADLMQAEPGLRIRNAAEQLGVSECALLATRIGEGVTRLIDDPESLLKQIESLGEVMALTRNGACVHERKGVYEGPQFFKMGPMPAALFVNPDIDLRLFLAHWTHAFAVEDQTKAGVRKSIQFFDKSGQAVHKIYMTDKSDDAAFDALVASNRREDQSDQFAFEDYAPKAADLPDGDIDWDGFRSAWEGLKDTHDFFPMLKKFKVGREQALRKIGQDFAYAVDNDAARTILELARDSGCEIMVFVGNRGCIQIHTGTVNNLKDFGTWFNVLDPKFNLHLNEQDIVRTWVTKKPTEDGIVTAVEVFDAEGELIATFFGARKPGKPELELWREIVAKLPAKEISHAA